MDGVALAVSTKAGPQGSRPRLLGVLHRGIPHELLEDRHRLQAAQHHGTAGPAAGFLDHCRKCRVVLDAPVLGMSGAMQEEGLERRRGRRKGRRRRRGREEQEEEGFCTSFTQSAPFEPLLPALSSCRTPWPAPHSTLSVSPSGQ